MVKVKKTVEVERLVQLITMLCDRLYLSPYTPASLTFASVHF